MHNKQSGLHMSISKFNIHSDLIAYDNITVNELKIHLEQSYHTKAGIFALCCKGCLKMTFNLTRYRIVTKDLIAIPPETFIQFLSASEDLQLQIVIFSQKLIQEAEIGKNMINEFRIIGKHFVLPLPKVTFPLYKEMFALLAHLHKEAGHLVSQSILQTLLSLIVQGTYELCPEQASIKEAPGSRHFQQYRLFIRLVHAFYTQQHQVAFYAKEMNLKSAALCRLVKKESGYTAMEIINETLIMDAKTQLRTCEAPVKDIALNLGFNNAAFFNKFFKRHVGMTPQMFRNFKESSGAS